MTISQLDRRNLTRLLGVTGLLAAMPKAALAQPAPMLRRPIPHGAGELLPVIGLGTSKVFQVGPDPEKRRELARVVQTMVDGGGSVIDTASSYGDAEEVIGDVATGTPLRNKLFVATKLEARGGSAAKAEFDRSLDRLRIKQLDLLQLHNVQPGDPGLAFFRDLKQAGLVRYIGATTTYKDDYGAMETLIRKEKPDFIEVDCSIADRGAEQRLIPAAAEAGSAVLIALPFGRASLFSKVKGKPLPPIAQAIGAATWSQFFLKYLIGNPAITCLIPGTDKPAHMADNLAAGRGVVPDEGQRAEMVKAFDALG